MSLTRPDELIYEAERDLDWVHPDLDLDYIEGVGSDVAAALQADEIPEVAYQPGDGTFYGLVFVPLRLLVPARPRVKDGRTWESHAIRGMLAHSFIGPPLAINALEYRRDGYLIVWNERSAYPLHLGDRGFLAASYVAEHWNTSSVSAHSLALLFRTVSHYLDKWSELHQREEIEVDA
jgi:hypothetical protein